MILRTGIIGLGDHWETRHSPALRALSDRFEIVAVYDPIACRANRVAKEWGARPVHGFHALAWMEDLDVVLVLSSKWSEELPLMAACDAGKAVYCAAPLEIDSLRANELRELVEKTGIAFVAELPYRHAPATLRLKELIATRLGEPQHLNCNIRQSFGAKNTIPEPFMLHRLIHHVDWCRYVINADPSSITSFAHRRKDRPEIFESVHLGLDFSSNSSKTGPFAQIQWEGYFKRKWDEAKGFQCPADMQVVCERGVAFIDFPDKLTWFDDGGQHTESLEMDRTVGEQLLLHFYRAVTSLLRVTSSLENAYQAVTILSHCQKSIEEGKTIRLPKQ